MYKGGQMLLLAYDYRNIFFLFFFTGIWLMLYKKMVAQLTLVISHLMVKSLEG